MTRDNIPLIAEERIIEQQTVEELREQITNLQNELAEQKRHTDKMDDLAWENLKAKEKLEKEVEELKKEKEQIQKELEREKGWWDKWINDSSLNNCQSGEPNFSNVPQIRPEHRWLIKTSSNNTYPITGKGSLIRPMIEEDFVWPHTQADLISEAKYLVEIWVTINEGLWFGRARKSSIEEIKDGRGGLVSIINIKALQSIYNYYKNK